MNVRAPSYAQYSRAVDLAQGFVGCWHFGLGIADAEEWARQLYDELGNALAKNESDDERAETATRSGT